jgi:adenosylcobinamide hydrolase
MNIPIKGVSVVQDDRVIQIKSESPLITLSSAILGGGYHRIRYILNVHVDKDFNSPDPKIWLRSFAKALKINEPFIGLLTAVNLNRLRLAFLEFDGFRVGALTTAGVRNASAAGITPPFTNQVGTINSILLLDACLSRAAMVNAVITATEAKTATLKEKNVLTEGGATATGTSTDTITIACTGQGTLQPYAGPATAIGWMVARAIRQSLEESLSAQ